MSSALSMRARSAFRSLRTDVAASELFALLAVRGLDALLLRGPVIARRVYVERGRDYGDSDVLVPAQRCEAVQVVLRGLGYVPVTRLGRAQHWRRPRDCAEVDLHLSLWGVGRAPAVLWQTMWARRTSLDLWGVDVPVPDLAGTAFVAALHASQHGAVLGRPLTDLERCVERFEQAIWADALTCAEETGSLVAFRQGLTMVPSGRTRLVELGLEPAISRQWALRRKGVRIPAYLFEGLTLRERASILHHRAVSSREEIAVFIDPRAAQSNVRLLLAHGRRLARLPVRTVRLAQRWRRGRAETDTRGG